MHTGAMTTTRVHYMDNSASTGTTACGRYVGPAQTVTTVTSARPEQTTCQACRKAMSA